MRTALACLVLVLLAAVASAEPSPRAFSVVDGLGVDELTANRLIDVLSRYDQELSALHQQRSELKRRLVASTQASPKSIEKLLDESMANQRALFKADERLFHRLRSFLSPRQTAHALMLLSLTEPVQMVEPRLSARRNERDALFPPGSQLAGRCDPFAAMHGCPR